MKILIADDSRAMRMIVTRTLRQAGLAGHELDRGRERSGGPRAGGRAAIRT